jgi:hypothetical protein
VAGDRRRQRIGSTQEDGVKKLRLGVMCVAAALAVTALHAAEKKVDLSKETVGKPPKTFEPIVGTWIVVQDGADKVIKVDGAPWKAAQDNPTKLLIDSARKLYGTRNEELMDNAKQFANYPVAVLQGFDNFSEGSISVKFKTIAGDADRCSGILFNVKPNGDWLTIRYNDTEHNVVLWEFAHGIRRSVKRGPEGKWMLDRDKWHELKMTLEGKDFKAYMDGELALEYTFGTVPGPGRNGAPPNEDLFPDKNPVLQLPVKGKVGLWSKSDSTSQFKDYVINSK